MERRVLVLSCRKAKSRDRGDGIGKGRQEISPWWVRFSSEINVMFSRQILFYSCYSLNIPSNNSKSRNQDAWLCWFPVIHLTEKKMNIRSTPVSVTWVSEKEGLQVSMQGGIPRRGNDTPFQTMLVWNLVFAIRWDKLFPFNSFFEIQLREKLFLEVLI